VADTLARDIKALAGVLATSGLVHLVHPDVYEPIMPAMVPRHREVIYASGVAELACAAGLLLPRTRSVAGWASLGLLLAVYPANLKMAVDSTRTHNVPFKAAAFARLPMQLPMLWSAYRAARSQSA
jgi:uncharacterized membrane protein